jgi:hypothetical protein
MTAGEDWSFIVSRPDERVQRSLALFVEIKLILA